MAEGNEYLALWIGREKDIFWKVYKHPARCGLKADCKIVKIKIRMSNY
jgi:hypothetical protein